MAIARVSTDEWITPPLKPLLAPPPESEKFFFKLLMTVKYNHCYFANYLSSEIIYGTEWFLQQGFGVRQTAQLAAGQNNLGWSTTSGTLWVLFWTRPCSTNHLKKEVGFFFLWFALIKISRSLIWFKLIKVHKPKWYQVKYKYLTAILNMKIFLWHNTHLDQKCPLVVLLGVGWGVGGDAPRRK